MAYAGGARERTTPRIQIDTVTLQNSITETHRILRTFELKVQKKVLRKGANAGGTVMVRAVKLEVPKVNRGLSKSITKAVRTYPTGNVAAIIGQNLKKTKYAAGAITNKKKRLKGGGISGAGKTVPDHLVSGRVQPHEVGTRRVFGSTGAMQWKQGGTVRYAYGFRHKGHGTDNFHERAYIKSHRKAENAAAEKISLEVDREAKALPKPTVT